MYLFAGSGSQGQGTSSSPGASGAPMTYMFNGRHYIIATVGWNDMASEFVALALPE